MNFWREALTTINATKITAATTIAAIANAGTPPLEFPTEDPSWFGASWDALRLPIGG